MTDIGKDADDPTACCGSMKPAARAPLLVPAPPAPAPFAPAPLAPAPSASTPMSAPTVASPCIDVCSIDPRTGWCEGCLRTIDEIAAWGVLTNAQKREVWKLLPQRRAAVAAQRSEPESR
jgi:predicted Fe-S protein YdhL (DUF1289 family)